MKCGVFSYTVLSVQGVICYKNQVEIPPIVKGTRGTY